MDDRDRHAAGMAMRRQVLGDAYVDAQMQSTDDFNRSLQDLVARHCWGEVWTRHTLPLAVRSLVTIAMLTALDRPDELRIHVRGALNNGCTVHEIEETILHAAIYCGVPAALGACRVAQAELLSQAAVTSETNHH